MQVTGMLWPTLVIGALLAGCSGGEVVTVEDWPEGPPGNSAYGVVAYDGQVPAKFLKKRRAAVMAQMNPPRVIATADGRIADAVITLESVAASAALAAKPPVTVDVDQEGSIYAPHVAVVPVGSSVRFLNSDRILHNVHLRHDAHTVDQRDMPAGEKWTLAAGDKARAISIGCNFHPWMSGHIKVVDTPYFGKSDERGRFVIGDVPDGRYRALIWHEELVAASDAPLEIEIKDGQAGPIRLLLSSR